ncbi:MAG: anion transporter [Roseateles depolymerans]|uniref:Anion transporter n=1 Tax=Roseateles depolymerans TaxID=76731 RepID=A0A2W5DLS7_9BURK|nr:MAG: anion transporter [Roseateles depolymerans]
MLRVVLRVGRALWGDTFFKVLLAGLVLLSLLTPLSLSRYPALVDWPTLAALAGLLLLTKGLELSGALQLAGRTLVRLMATERALALCLVLGAALLSTVLTNDVALFVVVPLTLGVCRLTGLPATRLIIFEALAVNAGSALTPIGNPQNLFIWQRAGVPFGEFVHQQLPLVAGLMLALLLLTAWSFQARPVRVLERDGHSLDRRLLVVSLLLYAPFLVLTDQHQAVWAVALVAGVFVVMRPGVLAQLDWGLLLVFVLMFIDLRLLAGLEAVQALMQSLALQRPVNLYLAGIGASQLISNVPAAIALAEYSSDWRVMAYAVNIGGFGLMIGSLANLIALRMCDDRRAWRVFHAYAIPALVLATVWGAVLLF